MTTSRWCWGTTFSTATGFRPYSSGRRCRARARTVFAYQVRHPEAYGVVEFGADGAPIAIVEKPRHLRSHWAVTGLYFYDNSAPQIAASLRPSARGELEITDLNNVYLSRGMLQVERFGRGYAWFDTGTHDSLLEASEFVRTIELRQGLKIACVEEVAFRMGYINEDRLLHLAQDFSKSGYGSYLERLIRDPVVNLPRHSC